MHWAELNPLTRFLSRYNQPFNFSNRFEAQKNSSQPVIHIHSFRAFYITLLFNSFYRHFVHNYNEVHSSLITLHKEANDLVTKMFFFLMKSRVDTQQYTVDRQPDSYFMFSKSKGRHSLSEITNCSSSQMYHLNIMCPHLNILIFSLKLFELPISEVLAVVLQYHFLFSLFLNLYLCLLILMSFSSLLCSFLVFVLFWLSAFLSR